MCAVNEIDAETASIAQEIAVDLTVVAVVYPFHTAISLTRKDVAANRTTGADAWCRAKVPFAGVVLRKRLVGKDTGWTDLDQITAEFAFQNPIGFAPKVHAGARTEGLEIRAAGIVSVVAHATVTSNTAVHLVADERSEILIGEGTLLVTVAAS